MSDLQGFGELKKPNDLLEKLSHDFKRMEESPQAQYAALDFFVTAEHLVDWIYPGKENRDKREEVRSSSAILRITSHIANGIKHFEAKAKHHQSVAGIKKDRYVTPGYVAEGCFVDSLLVTLTENEAKTLNQKTVVDTSWLAQQVLDYWSKSEYMV